MSNQKLNCSTSNPCGRNGYCEKNEHGEYYCSCIFWWSGQICNELTNSGIQVIILGCLLGLLIGVYYGLIIYRMTTRKTQQKKDKQNYKFSIGIKFNIHRSFYVFISLILIIASSGLIIKWFMIQSIHNIIVDQYRHNLSLFYKPHGICQVINYRKTNLIMFPMSCLLIFIFAFEYKRILFGAKQYSDCYFLPVPIDFFTNINRTFVAVTFAIAANELLEIANEAFSDTYSFNNGIVLVYLQQIFKVLLMGFRYYPILAAVCIDSKLSLLLGTFYSWIELPMTILEQGLCQPRYYENAQKINDTYLNFLFEYYGTGSFLLIIDLLTDIPRYACLSYIIIELSRRIGKKFLYEIKTDYLTQEEKVLLNALQVNSVEMMYLRNLFQSNKRVVKSNQWIYEWRNDFRFSSRILCLYSLIFLFLYFFLIQVCVQVLPYMIELQQFIQNSINSFRGNQSIHSIPVLVRPFLLAVLIGSSIVVIQLLLLLVSIRRNLFQVYRGDQSEIPRRNRSNYKTYAIGNFHFAGYLIAYVLWGLVLIISFLFILLVFIDIVITFSLFYIIELILKHLIPVLLIAYFKVYLNKFLARFAFLQDDGDVLAINNRRILMIFLYFNFFLDAFLGLFSSVGRLLKSVMGGIFYMCRLDYSPLGRKLESWDDGFNAYCGFIHTECTHRHPILLLFTAYLLDMNKKKSKPIAITNPLAISIDVTSKNEEEIRKRRRRIIQKWQMIVFLIRNPLFVFYRKAYFKQFHFVENHLAQWRNNVQVTQMMLRRLNSV
ncbi:unnamed protein product [Adineta steineri]|uniref:EGF-like domain-containing protein n=1 Tax=Adineta steineri TaxID=433720 RepID=A0A818TUN1_9BILA|nr:unnamed protein product [Adineta steineri]